MRLVTWNTQWRFGRWEPRQPLIADALRRQNPDVVLLQETWPDQAASLADRLDLRLLGFGGGYFDQQLSSVPDDERFGNAVLAKDGRVVIDESFDSPGDPAPRHLVAIEVGGLVLASVHLCHLADGAAVRAAQLKHIVGSVREIGDRFVIGGDCNLVPTSAEYRAAVDLGLHDSWDFLRLQSAQDRSDPETLGPTMVPANPEIGHTRWMNERNGPTVPADTGVRLDYLWTSEPGLVQEIDRFGIGPDSEPGARWPSDHLGLAAIVNP